MSSHTRRRRGRGAESEGAAESEGGAAEETMHGERQREVISYKSSSGVGRAGCFFDSEEEKVSL